MTDRAARSTCTMPSFRAYAAADLAEHPCKPPLRLTAMILEHGEDSRAHLLGQVVAELARRRAEHA